MYIAFLTDVLGRSNDERHANAFVPQIAFKQRKRRLAIYYTSMTSNKLI